MDEEGSGEEQYVRTAAKWYEKAAYQGYSYAQYNLAGMHYLGKGIKRNYSLSYSWYKKAAQQGLEKAQIALKKMFS